MSAVATYQIRCDWCGTTHAESGPSREVAAMYARHAGWNLDPRSDSHFCGPCWQALMHGADD